MTEGGEAEAESSPTLKAAMPARSGGERVGVGGLVAPAAAALFPCCCISAVAFSIRF